MFFTQPKKTLPNNNDNNSNNLNNDINDFETMWVNTSYKDGINNCVPISAFLSLVPKMQEELMLQEKNSKSTPIHVFSNTKKWLEENYNYLLGNVKKTGVEKELETQLGQNVNELIDNLKKFVLNFNYLDYIEFLEKHRKATSEKTNNVITLTEYQLCVNEINENYKNTIDGLHLFSLVFRSIMAKETSREIEEIKKCIEQGYNYIGETKIKENVYFVGFFKAFLRCIPSIKTEEEKKELLTFFERYYYHDVYSWFAKKILKKNTLKVLIDKIKQLNKKNNYGDLYNFAAKDVIETFHDILKNLPECDVFKELEEFADNILNFKCYIPLVMLYRLFNYLTEANNNLMIHNKNPKYAQEKFFKFFEISPDDPKNNLNDRTTPFHVVIANGHVVARFNLFNPSTLENWQKRKINITSMKETVDNFFLIPHFIPAPYLTTKEIKLIMGNYVQSHESSIMESITQYTPTFFTIALHCISDYRPFTIKFAKSIKKQCSNKNVTTNEICDFIKTKLNKFYDSIKIKNNNLDLDFSDFVTNFIANDFYKIILYLDSRVKFPGDKVPIQILDDKINTLTLSQQKI